MVVRKKLPYSRFGLFCRSEQSVCRCQLWRIWVPIHFCIVQGFHMQLQTYFFPIPPKSYWFTCLRQISEISRWIVSFVPSSGSTVVFCTVANGPTKSLKGSIIWTNCFTWDNCFFIIHHVVLCTVLWAVLFLSTFSFCLYGAGAFVSRVENENAKRF